MVARWKSDPIASRITPRVETAILDAINDTTAAAAIYAKTNHGWRNRTGTLEGSIRFESARRVSASRWSGSFGSYDVVYAIYLELGTRYIAAYHYLRNAADATFPTLGARLKARMR